MLDLSAWVSIINQSGATYKDAHLKLVAGDVNRVQPVPRRMGYAPVAKMAMAEDSAGFVEKPFDEFHLYTLGRTTTLPNNSTKQLELFQAARQVPARRLLIYDALGAPILWRALHRARSRDCRQYQGGHLPGIPQRHGLGTGRAAAGRPGAGVAPRQRGRQR